MNIQFGSHVFDRMEQRDIFADQIRDCIEVPEVIWTQRTGRVCVTKHFNGRQLKVVYKKTPKSILVITAYWME